MTGWVDAIKSVKVGIANEETAGTIETAPKEYVYTTSEAVLDPVVDQDELRAMGSRGLTFTVDKPYHITGNISSWAFPEDNGFGYMLYGAFGSATSATVTTGCYIHTFNVVDTQVPSFTVWMKTGVYEVTGSNCQVNKLDIKNTKASILDYSADIVGSQLATASTFGTATYVSGATKVFRSSGAKVYWDDTLSTNVEDVSISIDNGIDPQDAKSLGVLYADHILAGDRTVSGDLTIFVESTTEINDFWGSTTGPVLNKTKIPIMIVWESSAIVSTATTVGATTKVAGNGTTVLTSGGSYSATADYKLFEVKITEAGAANKMSWRANGGAWATATTVTTEAMTLSDGVTVTFNSATNGSTSDRWFFYAGKIPYTFMMYMPSVNINSFTPGSTGNRLNAKVNFTAEIDGTSGVGFDAIAFLINTEATAYSSTA
jgi:hypothetical protein